MKNLALKPAVEIYKLIFVRAKYNQRLKTYYTPNQDLSHLEQYLH